MRYNHIFVSKFLLILWIIGILYIVVIQPLISSQNPEDSEKVLNEIDKLESELKEQSTFYNSLLDKLKTLKAHSDRLKQSDDTINKAVIDLQNEQVEADLALPEGPVLPVLLIACNREAAIRRSLDLLIKYRPSQQRFPIIVSQDCGHGATKQAILSYGTQVTLIEQPDLNLIEVPLKEKKFRGYFNIARHYKWALNQIFNKFNYEAVVIVEDDLDIAPDFYEYFSATFPLLKSDPTLYCISAWNDNGKEGLIDIKNGHETLHRTDFFPGLGWMLTRDLWGELGPKWPRSYWDDWIRAKEQRQERACIRPEISRTRTFGKKGVSNGLFFEKYLKHIYLNNKSAKFTEMDLSYLSKGNFDLLFEREVQNSQVVTLQDVKLGRLAGNKVSRIIYHTKDVFKKTAKSLGLMDDFKAGVPRTGYKGVVTFYMNGSKVFLAPHNNWKGYDPSWS